MNNLSVALLSQGKVQEGIKVLEDALAASPSSVVVAEPFCNAWLDTFAVKC